MVPSTSFGDSLFEVNLALTAGVVLRLTRQPQDAPGDCTR